MCSHVELSGRHHCLNVKLIEGRPLGVGGATPFKSRDGSSSYSYRHAVHVCTVWVLFFFGVHAGLLPGDRLLPFISVPLTRFTDSVLTYGANR